MTRCPPAEIAAATRASACSGGTQTSKWIRLRCGRGASMCWKKENRPAAARVVQLVSDGRAAQRSAVRR